MKTKNHIGISIFIALLFMILYIFLAARPLGKEYHFSPEWKKSIAIPEVKAVPANNETIYFKLGHSIGYFTPDGQIIISKTYPSKASISSKYFAVYNSEDTSIPFYGIDNQQVGVLEEPGYPFFEEDRIYVFMPGGASYAKCAENGKTEWISQSTVPLTAFSSKNKYTASGYADGSIRLIENQTGIEKLRYIPGGSDYNVILGLDVSQDGSYIASISGHGKQRFVLTKNDGAQAKIVFHKYLDSDLTRRTVVKFCDDDKHILYNYEGYLGIYNFETKKNTDIKIDKSVIAIEEIDSMFFVLGQKGNEYTVYIIEKTDTAEGFFNFTAESAFIKASGNDLYIGQDSSISKVNISRK